MKISFILPVLDEAAIVVAQLRRLQPYRLQGHEVIVIDGGSLDESLPRAAALADSCEVTAPGRSVQMNRGAQLATGAVYLFLHVDTVLPDSVDRLINAGGGSGDRLWGWFDVSLSNPGIAYRVIAQAMNWRARLTSVCTGDQALFVSSELFHQVGGFPDIPLMEDIAISKLLRRCAKPVRILPVAVTSSRRWETRGLVATVLLMWQLRLLFWCGVSPTRLAQRYYPGRQRQDRVEPYKYPGARIVVFAREPVLGKVKTRLNNTLGERRALALYRIMTERIVATIKASRLAELELWVSSNVSHEMFTSLCNVKNIYCQEGGDLGHRMQLASSRVLGRAAVDAVLIVGTDCPAMNAAYLQAALSALQQGNDVVIGPAEDGGYVLIGIRRPLPELFTRIDWGTERVLAQTLSRVDSLQLRCQLLQPLWDVDREQDLLRLQDLQPPLAGY